MIFGIGTDIVEIDRIRAAIRKNEKFMDRMFTKHENNYYLLKKMKPESIAAGFAAKEAVLKSIGTGLRGFTWKDIEIVRLKIGKPIVRFSGAIKEFIIANGIGEVHISISHSKNFATATAVAEISLEREGEMIEELLNSENAFERNSIH